MTDSADPSKQRFVTIAVILLCGGYLTVKALRHFPRENLPKLSTESSTAPLPPKQPIPATFQSKIILPSALGEEEKPLAPSGVFYPLKRISREIRDGVYAVLPGEELKLLKRLPEGRLLLVSGSVEFTVWESQVTNDLKLAQEAERRDHALHPR
jgi:hypothetical protein